MRIRLRTACHSIYPVGEYEVVDESAYYYLVLPMPGMAGEAVALSKQCWEPVPHARWRDVTERLTLSLDGSTLVDSLRDGPKSEPGPVAFTHDDYPGYRFKLLVACEGGKPCAIILEREEAP
jgi:hypothetical protein